MRRNLSLLTDQYELTMSQVYFNLGRKDEIAVFDAFFRKEPFKKGYGVMGGLSNIINFINNIYFDEDDISYLRNTGKFTEEFLEYLKNFKFTGSIYAIPDGTPVFRNEPLVTVKAPIIEAQIIETALLSYLNQGICYTTSARRVVEAALDTPVMEFGARRALGPETAVDASECAIIAGCVATSNVLAGKERNLPISGTFAHSFVTSFPTEYEAFKAYADVYPDSTTLLVDTYNVLNSGVPNAIKIAQYLRNSGHELKGIRIDSGDLAYLSKEAKRMFVEAGFPNVKICLSNGLNERTIKSLKEQGAVIDSIGLGDNIVLPDYARVGCVYKLCAMKVGDSFDSRIKASNEAVKAITPGYKKVYRFFDEETRYALGDVVALYDENIPKGEFTLIDPINESNTLTIKNYDVRELQELIFENGKLVYVVPSLEDKIKYCADEMKTLYPEVKREEMPHEYYVDLTRKLLDLKKELIIWAKNQNVEYDIDNKLCKKYNKQSV